jgi:catechol 2,3-dioxygenase-like lactoylglutathione lyase family enzyme
MALKGPVPILYVTDIEKTILFYCDVLGFRCVNRFEGWAALQRDSAEIMLSLPNEHLPFEKSLFTGSFYLHAGDVDALWTQLREKAPVVYPLATFDYGMREFAIRDVNGYILQFGQEIQSP